MITVLRLGHRISRDKRITTHVALVARAFGARKMLLDTKDEYLVKRIEKVVGRFGGDFEVETGCNWRRLLETWDGQVVHLTMYGEPLDDALKRIPPGADLLVVIGAEKVPSEVFKAANFNVAVGNQPHSEVAALAIFLDRYFKGEQLKKGFKGRVRIQPSPSGKKIVKKLSTRERLIEILRDAGCDDAIIEHSIVVNRLAVKLAKLCNADVKLVATASMLHDIGRSRGHNVMHGIEGAKILRELEFPEEVVSIAEKHIGAGLDSAEASKLGLPPGDYVPRTLEEKIVCHADNLISHNKKIKLADLIRVHEKEGLKKSVERLKKLHKELSEVCGVDLDDVILD